VKCRQEAACIAAEVSESTMLQSLTTLLLSASLAAPIAPPADAQTPPAKAPETTTEKATEKPTDKAPQTPPDGKSPAGQTPDKPAPKPATVVGPNDMLHVKPQEGLPREKFKMFGEEFDCELCLDTDSRNAGMGARTEFPRNSAMIFVHPFPGLLNYWMKDCLIDMDMVMVDSQGVVCATHEAVREKLRTKDETLEAYHNRLHRYSSYRRAKYVVEFAPGTVARLKAKPGQKLDIDWKALDRRAK
jgi:uncharacterized membrane protein (UPF0127 family)